MLGAGRGLLADHSLGQQAGEGFLERDQPQRFEDTGEVARIQEVQDGMLHPADILIHRHPIGHGFRVEHAGFTARTAVALKIPGGFHEGIHGVGLPAGILAAAFRATCFGELRQAGQGRSAAVQKIGIFGQKDGQVRLGNGHDAAVGTVNHGDRRSPIALPGDAPVAQPEADGLLAEVVPIQMVGDGLKGLAVGHAVEIAGVDHGAIGGVGCLHGGTIQGLIRRADHDDDGQVVLAGKIEIALVVGRYRHDRTGAIGHQAKFAVYTGMRRPFMGLMQ